MSRVPDGSKEKPWPRRGLAKVGEYYYTLTSHKRRKRSK